MPCVAINASYRSTSPNRAGLDSSRLNSDEEFGISQPSGHAEATTDREETKRSRRESWTQDKHVRVVRIACGVDSPRVIVASRLRAIVPRDFLTSIFTAGLSLFVWSRDRRVTGARDAGPLTSLTSLRPLFERLSALFFYRLCNRNEINCNA